MHRMDSFESAERGGAIATRHFDAPLFSAKAFVMVQILRQDRQTSVAGFVHVASNPSDAGYDYELRCPKH